MKLFPPALTKADKARARAELRRFVNMFDSSKDAARATAVAPSTMIHWLNGRRLVSPEMATRIQKISGGEISRAMLVFGAEC